MNYEQLKKAFIKLKKEQLSYIDEIVKISFDKLLSENVKLQIYRKLKEYDLALYDIRRELRAECEKELKEKYGDFFDINFGYDNRREIFRTAFIEFDLDVNFLNEINFETDWDEWKFYNRLGIDRKSKHYKYTIGDLIYNYEEFNALCMDYILNGQKLIEKPIYIFDGCYYDEFSFISNIYGRYIDLYNDFSFNKFHSNDKGIREISDYAMTEFEKDKIIIPKEEYISSNEVQNIFMRELLDITNHSIEDCVNKTKEKSKQISYFRSTEYKEKVLLERINQLYEKIRGEFIQEEILYSGSFLDILRETYRLPNNDVVYKEKVRKNKGKDSVIVVAITPDDEYIITFQTRKGNEINAEFPSGYIENNEDVLSAAKRELMEETGYTTDDLFIVDEAFTSSGIDNSTTYIVIANGCVKELDARTDGTELVNYGLFSELELKYLIDHNIINGSTNKLAYYNLVYTADKYFYGYIGGKKVYRKKKVKEKLEL